MSCISFGSNALRGVQLQSGDLSISELKRRIGAAEVTEFGADELEIARREGERE